MIDWTNLLVNLGGVTVLVSAVAWLCREIIKAFLSKDLETFKSRLEVAAQERLIEYSSLHTKRAELVAELYSHLVALSNAIQRLMFELMHRGFREEAHRTAPWNQGKPWQLTPGIDTLDESETSALNGLKGITRKFYEFYGKNKIYFPEKICDQIDRFATLSGYLSVNYQNIAIKDEEGNLMVNPKVQEVWNGAVNTIPQVFVSLEQEFRSLLGVKTREPSRKE